MGNNPAIWGASALVLAAALFGATTAVAQTAAPASGEVSEVVVTGSRIRGVAPVGSALIGVDRTDIEGSSAVTVGALLQELPQVLNLGVSETSRGTTGGNSNITYGGSVNIRGIGPFATLVLINGHRVVPQGTSGLAVDPNVIPTLGLERVDIVADGASAIYGSDAVAGVANLILRRNLVGGEANARYGTGDHYNERNIGLAYGHKWDSGQFTVAFENGFHSNVNGQDRDYYRSDLTAFGGTDFRTTNCAPGNIIAGGVSYAIPAGGVTAATANQLVANTVNKCDQFKKLDLIPEQDHYSLSYTVDYHPNEFVTLFSEGFAARREFYQLSSEVRAAQFVIPRANPFFVAPAGFTGPSVTVQYSPGLDYPQATQNGWSRAVNVLFGGNVKLPHDWQAEATYSFGRNQDDQHANLIAPPAAVINAALASTNPTTAFNPFGPGGQNAALANSLLVNFSNAKGHSTFQGYEFKVDGPIATLPGGDVRVALGYEGQRLNVNQLQILGTFTAKTGASRYFSRGVNSVYGELLIPLVGEGNAMPLLRGLDIDLAYRTDRYSDVGFTKNPKIGVNYSPFDGLRLHGSWGTSFRAPGIAQIYGNSNNLFLQTVADPTCSCTRQVIYRSGGNLNLRPETAETYSFGAEFTPAAVPGLRLTASWFDVVYENQVTAFLGDLSLLQRESQFAGTGIITRNPSAALVAQQLAETGATISIPNPLLVFVDGRSANLGVSKSRGVDFTASYRLRTDNMGAFSFSVIGTRFTKYLQSITPSAPLINNLNNIYSPPKLRMRYGARWSNGPLSANLFANYLNAYNNNLSTPVQKVKSATTVDAQLQYTFDATFFGTRNIVLGLDARNLFDKDPPFVNVAQTTNGGGGYDPSTQSTVGRVISASLSLKF